MKKPKGKLEAKGSAVLEMLLAGGTEREVAAAFGASPRGVVLFKKRHAVELQQVREAALEAIKQDWITDRAQRIAKLQGLYEASEAEANQYGLTVVERRYVTDSAGVETVTETRDYRGVMVKEMRGLLRDAATELGQIVRPDIHIGDKNVFVLEIVAGGDLPRLG